MFEIQTVLIESKFDKLNILHQKCIQNWAGSQNVFKIVLVLKMYSKLGWFSYRESKWANRDASDLNLNHSAGS